MFHLTRRVIAGLPVAWIVIGFTGQPVLLAVPPAVAATLVLIRDRAIRRRVGLAAWPSDGFARHVLVDDLARLACLTATGFPLFAIGHALRAGLVGI
jgi:hypothetical protein